MDQQADTAPRAPDRPTYLIPNFAGFPALLCARDNWVVWKAEYRAARWTKVPFQAAKPQVRASVTQPETWASFRVAKLAFEAGGFDGVGFVLDGTVSMAGLAIAGVDIDKVSRSSEAREAAGRLVRRFNSYAERSPGGDGYRIFCLAKPLTRGVSRAGVEAYTADRYLTVTGHQVSEADCA